MTLGLIWLLACAEKETGSQELDSETEQGTASEGCGQEQWAVEEQRLLTTTEGDRGYFLVVPEGYDSNVPSRLIVGYPGTNWIGEQIRPYLGLEEYGESNDIFVYPDPLWRDFEGWGNLGGWVLGVHATPADGTEDLEFTEAILDELSEQYCIDQKQIYATGHSWGGDMAQVVSCFLGDRFRATVPVAANRPYWFESSDGEPVECVGDSAVWTMFGINDDHFTAQPYPGAYGDECRDFWLEEHGCDGSSSYTDLNLGPDAECVEFEGCDVATRYCLYAAEHGHQTPSDYFSEETMRFFHSFE